MTPEIAFVLAMDRVGFSLLPMERKVLLSQELTAAIHACPAYQAAQQSGRVISLDSGDGAALVFFGDPRTAMEAALDVHRAINGPGCETPLRIGVHSGPVVRRTDVAGKPNVDGQGIELAVRVMSAADGSSVLISEAYAAILRAFAEWEPRVTPAGEHTFKHGERATLYRVGTEAPAPAPQSVAAATTVAVAAPGAAAQRVALIYKRHTQPDGALLAQLEGRLRAAGFGVFVDRHLAIGVEWAQEIERQLRGADAVIALLSDRAGDSEMMLYELQVACNAREAEGKPAVLPVRIGSDTPLGGEIGQLVSRFQYSHWSGPADDERLWAELDQTLRGRRRPPEEPIAPLEQPGGAVPLDSPYYVERPTDAEFIHAVERRDSIVLVKGARQMGKTSLLARGVRRAREQGWQVVLTDFQTFSSSQLESDERLYKSLMHAFKSQLRLAVDLNGCWNDWLGANTNLEMFLTDQVLPQTGSHLIWAVDEVDRLFNRPYATDLFGMVRSWHNRRALEPDGVWQRLTVALSYATEAHLFITDLNQSPFNVGTRLSLADFTRAEVRELNERYGRPLATEADLDEFFDLLSGQPYLTRRAFDELVRTHQTPAEVAHQADLDEGIFGDHLRRLMVVLSSDPGLVGAARSLLARQPLEIELFYRLRTGGVIKGDTPAAATFRCRIYESYLRRHLA